MMQDKNQDILLEICSPEKFILTKMVDKVFLPGIYGEFEVLKDHGPLISILTKGCIRYYINGEEFFLELDSGFVDVYKNKVSVCLDK